MRESKIEKELCEKVKALGGLCDKFTSPQRRGVPDRLITLPNDKKPSFAIDHFGAYYVLAELKAPGKKPTKLQALDHERRRALGCDVRVIDSLEQVERFPEL